MYICLISIIAIARRLERSDAIASVDLGTNTTHSIINMDNPVIIVIEDTTLRMPCDICLQLLCMWCTIEGCVEGI